jgi:hemin uptake protein HemP
MTFPRPSADERENDQPPRASREPARKPAPRVRSGELFGASDRVVIEHGTQEYVLLLTRNGKLLLNRLS